MGETTEISNIDLHWFGRSIARKILISIDGQECIEYNNEQNTQFNGWTNFDKPLKGKIIEIKLNKGTNAGGPSKKAWFALRSIRITGRATNVTTKRHILKTFFNELTMNTIDSRLQAAICVYFDEKFFSK